MKLIARCREASLSPRTFLFLLLVFVALASTSRAAKIHLSRNGYPLWTGQCDSTSCTDPQNPCLFTNANNYKNEACDIVLLMGDTRGVPTGAPTLWNWQNTAAGSPSTTITVQGTAVLDLQLGNSTPPVTIVGTPGSAWFDSTFTLTYRSSLTISNLAVSGSIFNVEETDSSSTLTFSSINATWAGVEPISIKTDASISLLKIENSIIFADESLVLSTDSPIQNFEIAASTIIAPSLAEMATSSGVGSLATLSITSSMIQSAAPGSTSLAINSGATAIIITSSQVLGTATALYDMIGQSGSLLTVTATASTLSRVQISTNSVYFQDSDIYDCIVLAGSPQFVASNFTISTADSRLSISSSAPIFIDTRVIVSEPIAAQYLATRPTASTAPFYFSETLDFSSNSSLITNMMYLGPGNTVKIPNLELLPGASSIVSTVAGSSNFATLAAAISTSSRYPVSSWYVGDVVLQNIELDWKPLQLLVYTPSFRPDSGISALPTADLDLKPPTRCNVSVSWRATAPPTNATVYRFASFHDASLNSATLAYTLKYESLPGWNFKISQRGKIFSFQALSVDIPPSGVEPTTEEPQDSPSPVAPAPSAQCQVIPPGFFCDNGLLYANVTTAPIVVPGNLGKLNVYGNVSTTSSIVFQGTQTTLKVAGCINANTVELQLGAYPNNKDTKKSTTITLIVQDPACPNAINNLRLVVSQDKSCKKTKANISGSSSSTLTVLLTMDNSACNVKWIIVGSVIGGVLLIIIVIVIIVLTCNLKAKQAIRPYATH